MKRYFSYSPERGFELHNSLDEVKAIAEEARRTGGTGQALRIAEALGVPIFDLAIPGCYQKAMSCISRTNTTSVEELIARDTTSTTKEHHGVKPPWSLQTRSTYVEED